MKTENAKLEREILDYAERYLESQLSKIRLLAGRETPLKRNATKRAEDLEAFATNLKGRGHGAWNGMSPEERSAEMRRRVAVGKQRREAAGKLHPRDPAHPEHEAFIKKMRAASQKRWAGMTKKQRQERIDRMQAGKRAAKRAAKKAAAQPLVKLDSQHVNGVAAA